MDISNPKQEKRIEVKIGELVQNKTLKYLVPALSYLGPTFKAKIKTVHLLAFGLFDEALAGSHLDGQKNVYIMIDCAVRPDYFYNFMAWVRNQDFYVTDYVSDSFLHIESRKHMLVIAFPLIMEDVYNKFIEGKYSKMYTKEEIERYFSEPIRAHTKAILTKSQEGQQKFIYLIKELFGTSLTLSDIKEYNPEYDLPPLRTEEYF